MAHRYDMVYLDLPQKCGTERLAFYLAMEEWAAADLPADRDYFFAWRVAPTVICGRNQHISREVRIDLCREMGIDVVRRRSGGGCVYADMNNLMLSYICPNSEDVTRMFDGYTAMIASFLNSLDIPAEVSGRNDICISGRKVSGNAFYHLPSHSIAHGTMLFDFDPNILGRILTPSRAKVLGKGVHSVPARVTCLRAEGLEMDIETFTAAIRNALTSESYTLTDKDIRAIHQLEQRYYDPSFLRISDNSDTPSTRIDGVGDVAVDIRMGDDGLIVAVGIFGDFFCTDTVALDHLCTALEGVTAENVPHIVRREYLHDTIRGLDAHALTSLILRSIELVNKTS